MPDVTSMLPPLSNDFFDWNLPLTSSDPSSMMQMPELGNMPDLNSGLGISHDAEMADFMMPQGSISGMTIDPWDMDF